MEFGYFTLSDNHYDNNPRTANQLVADITEEALHADRTRPRWREIMGSVGLPRTNVAVRIADLDDRDVPVGEIGEVLCRGDVVMKGYWRNPEASAVTPPTFADGLASMKVIDAVRASAAKGGELVRL